MHLPLQRFRFFRRICSGTSERCEPLTRRASRHCHSQSQPARPAFAAKRTPLTLLRLMDAQCPLCQGVGCQQCASLGLR
jgi:hypothetical protein